MGSVGLMILVCAICLVGYALIMAFCLSVTRLWMAYLDIYKSDSRDKGIEKK